MVELSESTRDQKPGLGHELELDKRTRLVKELFKRLDSKNDRLKIQDAMHNVILMANKSIKCLAHKIVLVGMNYNARNWILNKTVNWNKNSKQEQKTEHKSWNSKQEQWTANTLLGLSSLFFFFVNFSFGLFIYFNSFQQSVIIYWTGF